MTARLVGTGERPMGVSADGKPQAARAEQARGPHVFVRDWAPGTHLCALPWSSRSGNSCSSTLSQRSRQLHSQSGLTTCSCPHSWAWRTFSVPASKLDPLRATVRGGGRRPSGRQGQRGGAGGQHGGPGLLGLGRGGGGEGHGGAGPGLGAGVGARPRELLKGPEPLLPLYLAPNQSLWPGASGLGLSRAAGRLGVTHRPLRR